MQRTACAPSAGPEHRLDPARGPRAGWLSAVAAAVLLAACATPGPAVPPPALHAADGLVSQPGAEVQAQWWHAFGNARLNALVEKALQDQPSLAVAQARARRAVAMAGLADAASGAQVQLSTDVLRERYSAHGLMPYPIAGNTWDTGNITVGLGWSPDFFGQHGAELAAAVGQAKAAQADAAAAASALATQVTRSVVALARLQDQRDVAVRMQQQRQAMQQLTRERVAAGLDTRVEQVQADGALPDVGAQIEALDEQIALARRQLAVLTAQSPDALDGFSPHLIELQLGAQPAVLGADLLGRRPDVVAARWRVEATLQDVDAAHAQFYPNVNLNAFVGLSALGLGNLLDSSSRQMGVQPAIRLPLFDGGRLRSQLQGRQADRDAAIAQYNGVLADAVREVGDALTSEASLRRQRQQQGAALQAAEAAYDIAVKRHRGGLGSYLIVLNAESQVLAQRRTAVDLQARELDVRAGLFKALGGGWQRPDELNTAALAATR